MPKSSSEANTPFVLIFSENLSLLGSSISPAMIAAAAMTISGISVFFIIFTILTFLI